MTYKNPNLIKCELCCMLQTMWWFYHCAFWHWNRKSPAAQKKFYGKAIRSCKLYSLF